MKQLTTPHMNKCNGCQLCTLACARLVHKKVSWHASGIRIIASEGQSTSYHARYCLACENPICAKNCSHGALQERAGGGAILDKTKCKNCGACEQACPVNAISSDRDGTYHCQHCGLCVQFCMQGCLQMQEFPA